MCPQWFVLDDVATGKLHLKLEWLSLLPSPEKLDQVWTCSSHHCAVDLWPLTLTDLAPPPWRPWWASKPTAVRPTTACRQRCSSSSWTQPETCRWVSGHMTRCRWDDVVLITNMTQQEFTAAAARRLCLAADFALFWCFSRDEHFLYIRHIKTLLLFSRLSFSSLFFLSSSLHLVLTSQNVNDS